MFLQTQVYPALIATPSYSGPLLTNRFRPYAAYRQLATLTDL